MQLTIEHRTRYAYGRPVNYTIQELRLTPQDGFGQRVKRWEIRVNGAISSHSDAFGNAAHTLVVDRPHEEINITAIGEVETDLDLPPQKDALPLAVFLRATPLTLAHEALGDFATLFRAKNGRVDELGLTALMHAIRERVKLRADIAAPRISALQAFVAGEGTCRDHAQIFIACCRKLGVPARFVSGYRFTKDGSRMESHAWADAWLEGKGWQSFDVTYGERANGIHVRLATGLDERDACPVNGVPRGSDDLMSCSVSASSMKQSQQ
jgi:transglutaminase-like putative cysteine protease